jgi:hypothetical protein
MMLSERLDDQVSQNNWKQSPPPMAFEDFQRGPFPSDTRVQLEVLRDIEGQMRRFQVEHEAELVELKKYYVFPADGTVAKFLHQHRVIPQLLLLAARQTSEYFGENAIVSLQAPIDESGTRTLYATILWPGKIEDVRSRLEHFDNEWWIAKSREAAGNLYFTYELV